MAESTHEAPGAPAQQAWSQGWWADARSLPSPNFDRRPDGTVIDTVVIHCISLPEGRYGTGHPEALFCNRLDASVVPGWDTLALLRVSAHFFIDRAGSVTQFVGCEHRAWHAGVSQWQGRQKCNDFSIGIELEGCVADTYDALQYTALGRLLQSLTQRWPIRTIVSHSEIAPDRKADPGPGFDWEQALDLAKLPRSYRP